jgi:DNA-binding MarR family transcriptional regulator
MTKEEELNNMTVLKLVRTAESLVKKANTFFKKFNVTTPQFDVLVIVNNAPDRMNQNDIGNKLVVSRSNITGLIDRLEKLGYVQREGAPGDRRVKFVDLTDKGKKLIQTVRGDYYQNLKHLLRYLNEAEKTAFLEIIDKIGRGIR